MPTDTGTGHPPQRSAATGFETGVARVRALLDQTLAQFGYARVPEPRKPEGERLLLFQELQRLLLQDEDTLRKADTRPKLARVLSELLARARAKVSRDQEWAGRYAEARTEEHADMVRAAGKSVPSEWRDL